MSVWGFSLPLFVKKYINDFFYTCSLLLKYQLQQPKPLQLYTARYFVEPKLLDGMVILLPVTPAILLHDVVETGLDCHCIVQLPAPPWALACINTVAP